MLDAIARALWRMTVSRKHLLEWETAADAEKRAGTTRTRVLAHDGALGSGRCRPAAARARSANGSRVAVALPLAALWLAGPVVAWWFSKPTPLRVVEPLTSAQERVLRRDRAQDVAVLRDVRRGPRPPPGARQLPGGPGRRGGVAHLADEHRTAAALLRHRLRPGLHHRRRPDRPQRARPSRRWPDSSATAATSTTGTTSRRSSRCGRPTSRRWTPATSPATCSCCASGCSRRRSRRSSARRSAGRADSVQLALEDLVAGQDGFGPPEAVRELRESLDGLARAIELADGPESLGEWSSHLTRIDALAAETAGLFGVDTGTGDGHAGGHAADAGRGRARARAGDTPRGARGIARRRAARCRRAARAPRLAGPVGRRRRPRSPCRRRPIRRSLRSSRSCRASPGSPRDSAPRSRASTRSQPAATTPSRAALGRRHRRGHPRRPPALRRAARPAAPQRRHRARDVGAHRLLDALRPAPPALLDRLQPERGPARPELLRPARQRVPPRELPRGRQGRRAAGALVPARARAHQDRRGPRARELERVDVRVPDAAARHARLAEHAARRDVRDGRARARSSTARTRGMPWGVSRVGVQRQGRGAHLPVPGVRRARSRPEARAVRRRRRRPVRRRCSRCRSTRRRSSTNLAAFSAEGAEGRYGYYEALDYTPGRVPAGKLARGREGVLRAPPGHGVRRARQRAARRPDARPLPLRPAGRLLGAAAAGARAARTSSSSRRTSRRSRSCARCASCRRRSRAPTHSPTRPCPRRTSCPTAATRSWSPTAAAATRAARTSRSRATARTSRATAGARSSTCATSTAARCSRRRTTRTRRAPDDYHVIFAPDKAEYRRTDGELETHIEIAVSPEDDVEVRRLTITNHGRRAARPRGHLLLRDRAHRPRRRPGAQVVLQPVRRDRGAPRDRRAALHPPPAALRRAAAVGPARARLRRARPCDSSFETDRAAFLGRLRGADDPIAVETRRARSAGRSGRCSTRAARSGARVDGAGRARACGSCSRPASRTAARARCASPRSTTTSAAPSARSTSRGPPRQLELRDLGISPQEAVTLERLASRLLLTDPYSPLKVKTPVENGLQMSGLWSIGISGDLPILLVRVEDLEDAPLVRQALLAHQYWRHKGLVADLVILNTRPTGYADELDDRLRLLVRTGHALQLLDKPGGVFLRRADQMHPDVLQPAALGRARHARGRRAARIELQLNRARQAPRAARTRSCATRERRERVPRPAFERPELALRQRARRLRPRDRRVRDRARGRRDHARAVDQRARDRRASAARSPRRASAARGRSTATRTASPRGTTTPSPTAAARRSTSATRRPASSGAPRRCPCARPSPTSSATAAATSASSTRRTASPTSSTGSSRPTTRCASAACGSTNLGDRPRDAVGHAVRRVGARRLAQPRPAARGHVVRRRDRDAHRAQLLQPRLPRPLRVPRLRPAAALLDGEPHRVRRPQRRARATRRRCAARRSAASPAASTTTAAR